MTAQLIRGVCPHDCPDTCGVLTEVEDGRAVRFSGDPEHPITKGWLCAKVRPYLDHVYHPGRLLHPLRRVGPKGSGPRRTRSAQGADCHLAPRPGTDGALALGMAHVLVAEGLHDDGWLQAHTVGWPLLRERLSRFPPERVAAVTGLPEKAIIDLA